jgi:hypothetical protein
MQRSTAGRVNGIESLLKRFGNQLFPIAKRQIV